MLFEDALRLGLQVVNMIGTLGGLLQGGHVALGGFDAGREAGDLAKVYESINSLAATVHVLVGENRGQSDTLRLILNQITQRGLK